MINQFKSYSQQLQIFIKKIYKQDTQTARVLNANILFNYCIFSETKQYDRKRALTGFHETSFEDLKALRAPIRRRGRKLETKTKMALYLETSWTFCRDSNSVSAFTTVSISSGQVSSGEKSTIRFNPNCKCGGPITDCLFCPNCNKLKPTVLIG